MRVSRIFHRFIGSPGDDGTTPAQRVGRALLWPVGTPRRALLTMVVVVVAVVAIVSTPGFSAGVIFGLITALILD